VRRLELLQHRVGAPRGEDVAGQEQHWQSVYGRQSCPRHHVRRAGADGGGAGQRLEPVLLPGIGGSRVDHRLLIARLVVGQVTRVLLECLPHARYVAVPENADASREKSLLDAVALDVLDGQKAHQRLGHRQPYCAQSLNLLRLALRL